MSHTHIQLTPELAGYMRSISLREPDIARRLREETAALPNGSMQISPEQAQFMALLVRLMGAERALEIGVFTGYSSLAVALALPRGGRLVACDLNAEWTGVAERYWREAGVDDKIELRLKPALESLDELIETDLGAFDFVFIDADKPNLQEYFDKSLQLLHPGGVILIDNILWHGRVIDAAENDADTVAVRAFNARLHEDKRVHIATLPIGDGLTLAMKRTA